MKIGKISKFWYKLTRELCVAKITGTISHTSERHPRNMCQTTEQRGIIRTLMLLRHYFRYLHPYDSILIVAGHMEPSARINESGIPTLKHIARILQLLSQRMERITCRYHGSLLRQKVLRHISLDNSVTSTRGTQLQMPQVKQTIRDCHLPPTTRTDFFLRLLCARDTKGALAKRGHNEGAMTVKKLTAIWT